MIAIRGTPAGGVDLPGSARSVPPALARSQPSLVSDQPTNHHWPAKLKTHATPHERAAADNMPVRTSRRTCLALLLLPGSSSVCNFACKQARTLGARRLARRVTINTVTSAQQDRRRRKSKTGPSHQARLILLSVRLSIAQVVGLPSTQGVH